MSLIIAVEVSDSYTIQWENSILDKSAFDWRFALRVDHVFVLFCSPSLDVSVASEIHIWTQVFELTAKAHILYPSLVLIM